MIMGGILKERIIESMKSSGMVPVFNHVDPDTCKSVVKACYKGGIRVFEFTNRSKSAAIVFAGLAKYVKSELPDMYLGVGSVTDAETTKHFIRSGADFIVSPALVPEMAVVCKEQNVMWIPGCGTVSEIVQAGKLGAEIIKLFPGEQIGGPGFVKAVLGPLPGLLLMPTGGVAPDYENLKNWFEAGVCCVGIGSKLFPAEMINQGDLQQITDRVKQTLAIIQQIRY